ncbi:MAG TPA: hypothetical protein DDZ88_07160 [Verrucomicrobiales bacterium]|nr:hypothetical protein [Verrucomicrobiales bacterium]
MTDSSMKPFGKGINSIPVRFALMSFFLGLISIVIAERYLAAHTSPGTLHNYFLITLLAVTPAFVTFAAATKLTRSIVALRHSTEAIASGVDTQPVDVDCACEVGGLADSFRKMVNRLNSSVTRMNLLAHTDAVTGLPNRSVITHVLAMATEISSAEPCEGTLLFVDLDNFKGVNDTLGHEAGDKLLRAVSDRLITEAFQRSRESMISYTNNFGELLQACPDDVLLSRFAGDEFVALIPGAKSRAELTALSQRIVTALTRPFQIDNNEVVIGASVGIAQTPGDTLIPNDLVSLADFAMYEAKQQGKSCFVFFDQNLKKLAEERRLLETEFRHALQADEFVLHYQPKLGIDDAKLVGVEALARWAHPTRGLVGPGVFVPLAEEARLMKEFGRRVIDRALSQCRAWCDAGLRIPIAINFSSAQIESDSCVTYLLDEIGRNGIDPLLIEVEITETLAMSDFEAAFERIARLLAAGVKTSIDDFGVGFSNLSQLSKLPVSCIKMDRSLIAEIGDRRNEAIIRAIVDMAHGLGNKVVAEGVEEFGQVEFLNKIGCDAVQGFLFARPMPANELVDWLRLSAALPKNGAKASRLAGKMMELRAAS